MPKSLFSFALVVLAARASCFSKEITFDCGELGPGATQTYVDAFPVKSKFATQVLVTIDASNRGTAAAVKCHIKWTIRGKSGTRTTVLFRHEDDPPSNVNGIWFGGASPDGSKLLLDFFTAKGDFTGHRPVVYDFLTGTWQLRDVSDRVTRNLPSCDYFTMVDRVNDDGDVILSVPKSIYVRQGCPDRGEWVLNMKTDEITRLPKTNAPPATQSQR